MRLGQRLVRDGFGTASHGRFVQTGRCVDTHAAMRPGRTVQPARSLSRLMASSPATPAPTRSPASRWIQARQRTYGSWLASDCNSESTTSITTESSAPAYNSFPPLGFPPAGFQSMLFPFPSRNGSCTRSACGCTGPPEPVYQSVCSCHPS